MTTTTTRRALLGTIAAAPLIGASAAAMGTAPAADTSVVDAIARARAALAASDHFHNSVYMPRQAAMQAALDARPHYRTATSYELCFGGRETLTTADDVERSRRFLATTERAWSYSAEVRKTDPEYLATLREQVAAADCREADGHAIRKHYRMEDCRKQSDVLSDLACDAMIVVIDTPATTFDCLVAKATYIDELGWWDSGGTDAVLADLRRLAEGR